MSATSRSSVHSRPMSGAAVAVPTMPLYPSSGPMLPPLADRLYRVFYGGLLSRVPEATAVRLGQKLFRALPGRAAAGPGGRRPEARRGSRGVRLPGPLILSSMYYDVRILRRAMALGFGAVTAKSITVRPRPGPSGAESCSRDDAGGAGVRELQRLPEPGTRGLPIGPGRAPSRPSGHRERGRRIPGGVPAARRGPRTARRPRRGQHLLAEHAARLRAVRLAVPCARAPAPRPRGHAEAAHPELSPDYPDENRSAIVPAALDAGIDAINFGNTRRVDGAALLPSLRRPLGTEALPHRPRDDP